MAEAAISEGPEAEDVSSFLPHMGDGEMKSDVEQEEHDAELGEQVYGATRRQESGRIAETAAPRMR